MTESGRVRRVAILAILLAAYLVAGNFGLSLAFAYPSATAVWRRGLSPGR